MLRFWYRALCLLLLVLAPSVAVAQEPAPKPAPEAADDAAKLKAEGDKYMDNLDFGKALPLYEEGYIKSKDPVFLYNMGRALQGLSRYPEALAKLEQFRKEAPPDLIERVPGLDKLIQDVRGNVATLEVTCNEPDARVLVNGKLLGTTPLSALKVNAGAAKVEVFKDGFIASSKNVQLPGNQVTRAAFELTRDRPTGILRVDSTTPGAMVSVDGEDIGVVPATTNLEPGEHTVVVTHPEFDTFETTVVIEKGATTELPVELDQSVPAYERWWFWTIIGTAVVGGAVAGIVYGVMQEKDPDEGTIPPGRIPTPFVSAGYARPVMVMLPVIRF